MSARTNMEPSGSFVEWSAIIAGSVLACAVSVVLLQFGDTLGLSIQHFSRDKDITSAKLFTVGLWLLWVQLMASMSGAYLAGRMRAPWTNVQSHESEIRDGVHGLLVWGTSTLVAVATASLVTLLTAVAYHHGVVSEEASDIPEHVARRSAIIWGFSLAASSIASAVAAWGMGVVGGDHRDSGVMYKGYVSFRKKR